MKIKKIKSDGVPEAVSRIFYHHIFAHARGEFKVLLDTKQTKNCYAKYLLGLETPCNRIRALCYKNGTFISTSKIRKSLVIRRCLMDIAAMSVAAISMIELENRIPMNKLRARRMVCSLVYRTFMKVFIQVLIQKTTYKGSWATFGVHGAIVFLCHRFARTQAVIESTMKERNGNAVILGPAMEDGSVHANLKDLGNYAMMFLSICG